MYQSVSRPWKTAQPVPQKVSPQAAGVKIGGVELQPPLVSLPHGVSAQRRTARIRLRSHFSMGAEGTRVMMHGVTTGCDR